MSTTYESLLAPDRALFHVTLTVGGVAVEVGQLREGLERLAVEHSFLVSARFSPDRAELRYWEEATCVDDAAALALRLWGEHRSTAGLPAWQVVGIEVLERGTYRWRSTRQPGAPTLVQAGRVSPF